MRLTDVFSSRSLAALLATAFALTAAPVLAQYEEEEEPQQVFVDESGNEVIEDDQQEVFVDDQGYEEDPGYQDPAYQGEYVEEPYEEPARPERPGRQLSLYLDVPIFLTNADIVRPGVGAHLRFGWEFAYLVPQVSLGISTNFLDDEVFVVDNLNAFWATLGVRLQILNRSRFVPVVDAGLRLQFWNYSGTDAFGAYAEDYRFEPGITLGGGLAIELTQSFGLEVGVQATVTFPISDIFTEPPGIFEPTTQVFLMPYLGGTLYF
jgi:hypothetical protein